MQRPTPGLVSYEQLLDADAWWALNQGSRHFEEDSAVFHALRNIAQRLKALDIPYAVVGGMALFHYGLRRFTEDVDILVTRADLITIHDKLEGLGYVVPHKHKKQLREAEYGVRIDFNLTGDFPGDGKPKPVAFPDPRAVSAEFKGVRYLTLPKLVELKLASGMTNRDRGKDIIDVYELIKVLDIPTEFVGELDPFVGGKFLELREDATNYGPKSDDTQWRAGGESPPSPPH